MTLPQFRDAALLERALTHASYANEHPEIAGGHNERLEFLGDAVLDFIAADWLFRNHPELDEGRLTTLRAALVRVQTLADFARAIGLPEHVRLGKGEEESGGRDRANILGDAFEALLGALYLDQGIEAARAFLEPLLAQALPRIMQANLDRDAKSRLQEWAQGTLGVTPRYRLISSEGPDHAKMFTVAVWIGERMAATGRGSSKQQAEQAAAAYVLEHLDDFLQAENEAAGNPT
ncbi:MAG: ribonuclease III [Thermoflexales bacterium]|nr:ribonuclease III [Thermoflexales bacterium]MCS7324361.1 ribonuclease III [Thermoflexales bacterium]MDW8054666.1 ribonuclease III [Anaerolineae bacterium]MDW8293318.1 ribonuclease III [Anaerolineae bacterium]